MGKVRVEVFPWLTHSFEPRPSGRLAWEEKWEGGVVRDLVRQLVDRYPRFIEAIYDPQADIILGHIEVIINDTMRNARTILDEPLNDGDVVAFVPGFSGGS